MIVVLTESGTTARLIAKYRPSMPVLALTAIPETARFTQVGERVILCLCACVCILYMCVCVCYGVGLA